MNTKSQSHYSATSLRIRSGIVAAALSLLACQQVSAADGTVIGELAETMAPGQWAELVSTGADNAFSASDSIFEYCDKIIWDPVGRQLLFYGTSDPAGKRRSKVYSIFRGHEHVGDIAVTSVRRRRYTALV